MLRPGLKHLGSSAGNAQAYHVPFVYGASDTAILEFTNGAMRVWVNDALVTRASVSTAITNGTFDTNLTGWTDADESGATSAWATGGYMSLVGTDTAYAIRRQQVTVGGSDQNIRHALRIVIARGNVRFKVGSTSGGDEYINETLLRPGAHSISFIPTGDFHVEFANQTQWAALVDSCAVESSGVMSITSPYATADLPYLRADQSADVVFIACYGKQQRRVERRGTYSWSLVLYETTDGPFRRDNLTPTTIASSALTGDVTLTASRALFRSAHVGALFKLVSSGQVQPATVTAENTFTSPIEVFGIGGQRAFSVIIAGAWTATVTLQVSYGAPGSWVDSATWTSNVSVSQNDGLDNQDVYYRIGVKTGAFTSGSISLTLSYTAGSQIGVARITGFTSSTSVSAALVESLGGTAATSDWAEGEWSDYRGYPSAVSLYEGRLWWAGITKIQGSISDAFDSFDDTETGDSGPFNRSIGSGPVNQINWLAPLLRLAIGTDGGELTARSSSFDEPLTPTNFNIKTSSTQGSTTTAAVIVDRMALYAHRSGNRLMQFMMDANDGDYQSIDLSQLAPDIGSPGIVRIAAQRKPDTRIHCIRSDGTAAVLVLDRVENVLCWTEVETDGEIEDVVVLPGTTEDGVYYSVARTIDGASVRYLEKWALESDCQGGAVNKQADAFLEFSGNGSATVSGLSHLEGETVCLWADGKDYGTYTVESGSITASAVINDGCVGLPYTAQWKSAKLADTPTGQAILTQIKRISSLGLVLYNTHYQGLEYGPSFDALQDLPLVENGTEVAADTVHSALDSPPFGFPGEWSSDARLCLQASAPRPCTVLAAVMEIES